MSFRGLSVRISRYLVSAVARLVPRSSRRNWQREWHAEIEYHSKKNNRQTGSDGGMDLLSRVLGASVDAWHLRREEWNMEMLGQEMRYALRRLKRAPMFTIVAVGTLTLGIGANTAVFSVLRGVVLSPLPYDEPDHLVMIWEQNLSRGWPRFTASPANYVDWRNQAESFVDLGATSNGQVTLTGHGDPETLSVTFASPSVFSALRSFPQEGRTFRADEVQPGRNQVVVISAGLRQRLFGTEEAVVGKTIELDGSAFEVIGVMADSFAFPSSATAWLPLTFDFDVAGSRGAHYLRVVGRLTEGATLESVNAEMSTVAAALSEQYPSTNDGWGATVVDLHSMLVGDSIRQTLFVLWGAVGFVLLITCVNVANLFLARTTARRVEFAVRSALGAGRSRLVRQMLTESFVVSAMSAVLGVGLAILGVRVLVAFNPTNIPRLNEVSIDSVVLAVTLVVALAIAFLVGLVPVVQGSKSGLFSAVRDVASVGGAKYGHALRRILVVVQVAIAVTVVIGSGLVMRSLWRLQSVDPGFGVEGVAVFDVSPPSERYQDYPQLRDFYNQILSEISSLSPVTATGVTNLLPLGGDLRFSFTPASSNLPREERPSGFMRTITPTYFEAIGIPLLRGRVFSESDRGSSPVVIINELLADRYFSEMDPIGQYLNIGYGDSQCPCEVVGVVGNVKQRGLGADSEPGYYLPLQQTGWRSVSILARTTGDPSAIFASMRSIVTRRDPALAIENLGMLSARVTGTIAQPRFSAWLLAMFGAISLVLAIVGVYGVMAYAVSQRIPEIGVRMALGARASGVAQRIVREGATITAIGIGLGVAGAFGLTRFLSSLLFQVQPFDSPTVLLVVVVLSVAGLASSYLPARRAAKVDPAVALRVRGL